MKFIAKVYEPMYDFNDKKYIRYIIPVKVSEIIERMHTNKSHLLMNQNIDNPLDGTILTVKVPFRYRRVMCNVKGRPIQSLIKDDEVEIVVDFKGVWNVGTYSGFSWILSSSSLGDLGRSILVKPAVLNPSNVRRTPSRRKSSSRIPCILFTSC